MIAIRTLACALLAASLASGACGRSQGVADQDLGGLVVAQKPGGAAIDVDRAVKDPDELGRALMRPFRAELAAMGPHGVTMASRMVVEDNGATTDDLADKAVLEIGDKDTWHGVYTNSKDYGREGTYVGGQLYLKPRYQRWHQRAPEAPDEPAQLRDAYTEAVGAAWDLVAPGAELSDGGTAQVAGRMGRKVVVKLSPTPRPVPVEALAQRKWRMGRSVAQLAGEVVLDAETGVPLKVDLSGAIEYTRDGKRLLMKLVVSSEVAAGIGTAVAIATPAQGDVVATPERLREVDDRDFLLQGIAPPLRKNADGTGVKPDPAAPKPAAAVVPEVKKPDEPKPEHKHHHKPNPDGDGSARATPAPPPPEVKP